MNAKRKERVALLVEPRFQATVLLYVNALALILLGITGYAVFRLLSQLEGSLSMLSLAAGHPYLIAMEQQRRSLWAMFGACSALVFFLANVGALMIGHRIAGPIYRIRKQLQLLSAGNKESQIRFRKTDFFKHLEKEWNDYFGKS